MGTPSDEALKVGYLNVRGLGKGTDQATREVVVKWPILSAIIPEFDVLFLAETWFLRDHDQARRHHNFLVASLRPDFKPAHGHYAGGLLCFVSDRVRHAMSQVTAHHESICVRMPGMTLVAVYTPPSMTSDDFAEVIRAHGRCHVLMGDINARFGRGVGDSISGPAARVCAVRRLQGLYGLRHVLPTNATPRLDHVFVSDHLPATVQLQAAPIPTDHPVIVLDMQFKWSSAHVDVPLRRFHLRCLDYQCTRTDLGRVITAGCQPLKAALDLARKGLGGTDRAHRQCLVDWLDGLLMDCLQGSCEEVIGSYAVSDARMQTDTWNAELALLQDNTAAVMAFKRAQRSSTNKPVLQSRVSQISACQDAVEFYREAFAQPQPTLSNATFPDRKLGVGEKELGVAFSTVTVDDVIRKYPSSRSCGIDSIHVNILKVACDTPFTGLLSRFFQFCCVVGLTPTRWNEALLYPIPKGEGATTIDQMRPISLTVMFRRVFEACLLRYVESADAASGLRRFNRSQAGFRRGYSTLTHAILTHEHCLHEDCITVFLDLQGAYDSVPVPLLLSKLEGRGATPGLLSLVAALFLGGSAQVVVNGRLSSQFERQRGLMQGSLMSPFLFNVFIDDLADELFKVVESMNAATVYPEALFFADDIQLQHALRAVVQRMLDACEQWAGTNGMKFNLKATKSATLTQTQPPLTLYAQPLAVVEEYKYLGFPHRKDGVRFEARLRQGIAKARNFLGHLRSRSGVWPEWLRVALCKCFVRPCFEYGAPILYHLLYTRASDTAVKDDLLRLHLEMVGWATGTGPGQARAASAMADMPYPDHRFYALAVTFQSHLQRAHRRNPVRQLAQHLAESPLHQQPRRSVLTHASCSSLSRQLPDVPPLPRDHPSLEDGEEESPEQLQARRLRAYHTKVYARTKLASYITQICRRREDVKRKGVRRSIGMDQCLYLRDRCLRRACIRWRVGVFGVYGSSQIGRPPSTLAILDQLRQTTGDGTTAAAASRRRLRCPECGDVFDRGHVPDCGLLTHMAHHLNSFEHWMTTDPRDFPHIQQRRYMMIDALLNHKQYAILGKVLPRLMDAVGESMYRE